MIKYLLLLVAILIAIFIYFCFRCKENFKNNIPIDAVVTWVNSTDPNWIESYEYHSGKTFETDDRWTQDSILDYPEAEISVCLEMIRKNMPWIRNTYVVTAYPQYPKCIKNETVVYHHEIGLGEVFNSHAIESSLHKINGLSENFVYFNDDIYVRKPLKPSAFIDDSGKPLLHFKDKENKDTDYWENYLYDLSYKLNLYSIIPSHVPYSLTISMLKLVELTFPEEWEYTRNCKFRYNNEISPIYVAMCLSLFNQSSIKAYKELDYLYFDNLPAKFSIDWKLAKEKEILCINVLDGDKVDLIDLIY
jgi:hypothetical protein